MEPIPLSPEQRQELTQLAETLDEKLRSAGAVGAEQAFGLGFVLGIVPLGVVLMILFAFKVISLIFTIILGVLSVIILVTLAALLSIRARANAVGNVYSTSVGTEIAQYLASHAMTRLQFDTLVYQILSQDAPLLAYLSPSLAEGDDTQKE